MNREERDRALGERREELLERLGETYAAEQILAAFDERVKQQVRGNILEKGVRPDGRGLKEIRPISAEVGILPRTHGSGLFTRGQTQALTIATLGSASEEQRLDTLSPEDTKRFLHHYNFPPFSVGEVRRMGSPSRRDIGHGALAERAIEPVIPAEDEFPYTIRLVTEVLSSNGSTSMASVCGSTLALMDAGVPIKAPVAGHRDGADHGRGRQVHDPHRHRRPGRRDGRHGLQGRRHRRGHHGPPDGHQGQGHHARDHGRGAGAGQRGPAGDPGQDARDDLREQAGALPLRSAHVPDQDTVRRRSAR